jgi:hypothetical protein
MEWCPTSPLSSLRIDKNVRSLSCPSVVGWWNQKWYWMTDWWLTSTPPFELKVGLKQKRATWPIGHAHMLTLHEILSRIGTAEQPPAQRYSRWAIKWMSQPTSKLSSISSLFRLRRIHRLPVKGEALAESIHGYNTCIKGYLIITIWTILRPV